MAVRKKKQNKVDMLPPITTYYNRLKAFLEQDSEVTVELDYDNKAINVSVHNPMKAAAWREIIPETIDFESCEITINVASDVHEVDENILITAMTGNELFSRYYHWVDPEECIDRNYCYFKPTIVQFYNDNFGSPESLETRTAEDLAKELFIIPTLNMCTEPVK